MNPSALNAWAATAVTLANAGVQVGKLLSVWIGQAHPELSAEQVRAAYEAILNDDRVRLAFSQAASGGE